MQIAKRERLDLIGYWVKIRGRLVCHSKTYEGKPTFCLRDVNRDGELLRDHYRLKGVCSKGKGDVVEIEAKFKEYCGSMRIAEYRFV